MAGLNDWDELLVALLSLPVGELGFLLMRAFLGIGRAGIPAPPPRKRDSVSISGSVSNIR